MKLFSRKLVIPATIIGLVAMGGGMVYAFTSSDFSSRAASWASTACSQSLINSKNTTPNNRTATICYDYYLSQENAANIKNISPTKTLSLIDGTGSTLGTVLSDSSFYNPSLNRIVSFDPMTGNLSRNLTVYFTTPDCSGTPYVPVGSAALDLVPFNGSNYIVNPSTPTQQMTPLSDSYAGNSCIGSGGTYTVQALTQVNSLPFTTPLAVPLSLSDK